ncbi:MAG: ABC transporter substrate-binding protein, partial [Paracoccaceae bacterium]
YNMKTNPRLPQGENTNPGGGILKSARALMIAAAVTVSLGAGAALAGPDDRPDLKVAMPSTWASHGPTVNSNFGARVAYSIYDTLVWRNYLSLPDGSGAELVPGLATSWEQVTPTEWDFTLRQGVKFHDGTTMTTDDVAFSIDKTYGDGSEPFAASGTIASVVALDTDTVRITTKNPDPALLTRMATVMGQIYSKAYYESIGREEFGRVPAGTGPYKWGGRAAGEPVTLEANDDYWGGKPPLRSIKFIEVPEVSSRIAGLITGEYDIVTSLPPDQTRPIDNADNTEIRAVAVENVQMVTFRQYKKDRPQSDKRIRKAMALSLNRALLADKLWAGMTEAGYEGEEISIRIVSGYYTNMTRAMEVGVEMWKEVGLNVRLDIIENWGQMGQKGDAYNASDNMWMTDPGGGMWFSWGREGGHRLKDWGGTPPAEFAALGTAIEQGSDFATRKQAYCDLLDLWDDLVPAILLYRPVEAYGVRKNLEWQPYTFFDMDFRAANVKDNG